MAKKIKEWSEGDVERIFTKSFDNCDDLITLENGEKFKQKVRNADNKVTDMVGFMPDGTKVFVEVKQLVSMKKEGIDQLKTRYIDVELAQGNKKMLGIWVGGKDIKTNESICFYTDKDGNMIEVESKSKNPLIQMRQAKKELEKAHKVIEKVADIDKDVDQELRKLHEYVRNYGKISANEKVILLNAVMMALNSNEFCDQLEKDDREDYDFSKLIFDYASRQTGRAANLKLSETVKTALKFLDQNGHPMNEPNNVPIGALSHNSHIKPVDGQMVTHLSFSKFITNFILFDIINPLKAKYKDAKVDVSSKFYNEFLKYTKSDGKDLGIVLTPPHISDLMIDLIDIKPNDVLLDLCTGSGAFLVSGMKKKLEKAKTEEEEKAAHEGLVGVEMQPHMFVLAFANTLFNGGDLSGLIYGNCYEPEVIKKIKTLKPTCGILNPPYSMYKNGSCEVNLHEWSFVKHALDLIEKGGKLAVIVPTSCGIKADEFNKSLKEEILDSHTLTTIVKCNDKLFEPQASTATSIYVFEAGVPHKGATRLIDASDDGFKKKRQSRVDVEGKWPTLRNSVLEQHTGKNANLKILDKDSEWEYQKDFKLEITYEDFVKSYKSFYYEN